MSEPLRVAIIGAGKIGKQHAKWYQMAGCRVVGFLGSSAESVARTRAALQEMLGSDVPGYTDMARLAAETRPRAVSICSPHALHCAHVLQAVELGLPALCEKPLAWDERKSFPEILADGRRMVAASEERGVLLGMNAQYVSGIEPYRAWYESARGPLARVERFETVMQSRGRGGGAEFEQIWTDLSSHPLSLLLKWVPEARLDPDSVRCHLGRKEAVAEFRCFSAAGDACECLIRLGNVPDGPIARCFGVNGFVVDYAGRNDSAGVFRAYLQRDGEERELPDFLLTAVSKFAGAVRGQAPVPISAREGLRNLELQIALLEQGKRAE